MGSFLDGVTPVCNPSGRSPACDHPARACVEDTEEGGLFI